MEALGIDIKLLAAQLINFLLFTYIFTKFMYTPFKKWLAEQHKAEKDRDELLVTLQEKEQKLDTEREAIIAKAQAEAADILSKAEASAQAKRKDILAQAQEEATAMKQKAQADIEDEKSRMYDELREKVIKTSEAMTENVLRDFLSDKDQKGVLKHVFSKLKSTDIYEN